MNIGYARVSTDEQNLNLQIDALTAAGCDRIFRDEGVSATAKSRPQFTAALNALEPGDRLVIWKMDRAFRSLLDALKVLDGLEQRGNAFHSLTEAIDTHTPMGRFAYQIINAFGELEHALIVERTRAGMLAAQQRGAQIGRPRKLSRPQIEWAMIEIQLGNHAPADIAAALSVSERTLRRTLPKSAFSHPQPFFQQPIEEK
ncbi:MAG: recombinase family protein [Hyphomonas sp.]|nr:recombinase family protein [Hyphomonas sp.]